MHLDRALLKEMVHPFGVQSGAQMGGGYCRGTLLEHQVRGCAINKEQ